MSTQKNFSSKTVLITGASTGFGRDTAETLTREGHRVFASFRDIAGRNKSHADALRAKDIKVVELDVINNSSVESAVGKRFIPSRTDRRFNQQRWNRVSRRFRSVHSRADTGSLRSQ